MLKNLTQKVKILSETLTDLISDLVLPCDETSCCLCLIQNVFIKMKVLPSLTCFILFVSSAKLLEEAVAEAVAEAEVVEEEEGAQDDNFSPHNCYQILDDLGYFFVQVLFMVSIFNKRKCEKLVFPLLVKSGEGGMSCFWRLLQTTCVLLVLVVIVTVSPAPKAVQLPLAFCPRAGDLCWCALTMFVCNHSLFYKALGHLLMVT